MHGYANGVEAGLVNEMNILAGDVGIAPGVPEGFGLLRSEKFGNEVFNFARGLRATFEVPHITLGDEPVAEVGATHPEGLVVAVDDLLLAGMQVLGMEGSWKERSGQYKEANESNSCKSG